VDLILNEQRVLNRLRRKTQSDPKSVLSPAPGGRGAKMQALVEVLEVLIDGGKQEITYGK